MKNKKCYTVGTIPNQNRRKRWYRYLLRNKVCHVSYPFGPKILERRVFQQNLQYNLLKIMESDAIRRSSLIIIILTLNWLIGIYGNYRLDPYINNNASPYWFVEGKLQNITVYFKYTKLQLTVRKTTVTNIYFHKTWNRNNSY